jgi:heme-degrading monooxygenase HmoA
MAEISAGSGLVTFVNVFTCDPEDQQALLGTLRKETEDVVSKIDGFVSASLHLSTDGRRVINYAQWTTLDAFNAMMAGEQGREMIQAVHQYAKAIDIHLYDVGWQLEAAKAAAP